MRRVPLLVPMVAGVLFLACVALGTQRLALPRLETTGWMAIAFLGTFGGALGFYLWLWALQHLTPTTTAVFLTLNPIAATLLAVSLLGEHVSPSGLGQRRRSSRRGLGALSTRSRPSGL